MTTFTAACVQLRSSKSIPENTATAKELIRAAANDGASFVQTPEMSNILVRSRDDLFEALEEVVPDPFVAMARDQAAELGIFLHLGSLAVVLVNGRVANRSYLIAPDGEIQATYDKIHMFDVDLPSGESWRESATYKPGEHSPVVEFLGAKFGMAICYDIRFPALFRSQSKLGAEILTSPAAFTRQTGEAHWHVLQRARAIENGAYVVSAAQGGLHDDGRETYGHSLVVDPWGTVIAELDHDDPGYVLAEIDTENVAKARARIPAIKNEREFTCRIVDGSKEMPA
ncbi:MAG: carbon-nitrogen hydrolase family protein [Roseibium sp.]